MLPSGIGISHLTISSAADQPPVRHNGRHDDPITSTPRPVPISTEYRSSDSSSDSSSSCSSSSEDSCTSEDAILRHAGVTFDLATATSVDGHAPLELVSQCVTCMFNNHHAAASLLCQKVMELEPDNTTVQEIYPVLQERLRLDKELPTESSSDSSSDSSDSDSESSGEHPEDETPEGQGNGPDGYDSDSETSSGGDEDQTQRQEILHSDGSSVTDAIRDAIPMSGQRSHGGDQDRISSENPKVQSDSPLFSL